MKNLFEKGDQKHLKVAVTDEKLARFDAGLVHPVYSTFALGKDAEWACRLFVLDMKEPGEEGVGAALTIEHVSPAVLGSEVLITATIESIVKRTITCSWEAKVRDRLVAKGTQVQKIVIKERFDTYIAELKSQMG
ncbi:thioesterase, FlK family [Pontibacter sp. G13]|uniref:thioesterase family protein n=1 Tax=Pontibacter sp. G13 TaxID=3074898 RepID=UPI002889C0C0|nr:hotdog domain-containing protein [Pontibacter sp. G13]WNJ19177.1 hotdog domain-containing protein [Pontibacter sp. G13]